MQTLAGLGAFIWFIGLSTLAINVFGDSGTPTITHVDTLGLGMCVSGAILALGSRD
jgi:xanthine/uracil/vitamin C permease (AzgA family)